MLDENKMGFHELEDDDLELATGGMSLNNAVYDDRSNLRNKVGHTTYQKSVNGKKTKVKTSDAVYKKTVKSTLNNKKLSGGPDEIGSGIC